MSSATVTSACLSVCLPACLSECRLVGPCELCTIWVETWPPAPGSTYSMWDSRQDLVWEKKSHSDLLLDSAIDRVHHKARPSRRFVQHPEQRMVRGAAALPRRCASQRQGKTWSRSWLNCGWTKYGRWSSKPQREREGATTISSRAWLVLVTRTEQPGAWMGQVHWFEGSVWTTDCQLRM